MENASPDVIVSPGILDQLSADVDLTRIRSYLFGRPGAEAPLCTSVSCWPRPVRLPALRCRWRG